MPPRKRPAVLVVEDEAIVAHDLQQTLAGFGFDAYAIAASAEEALARAAERAPDVALVDIRIKGRLDGTKAAQLLGERYAIPFVYLTAHADDATLRKALATQPAGYLLKPVKSAELRSALEIALQKHAAAQAPAQLAAPAASAKPARAGASRAPGAAAVRRALDSVLTSGDFDASRRSLQFLRFIVEETLAGRGGELTQAAIATRVFGRRDDFDPVVDPIVRIQAGRLRRSLERYYLLAGKQDPVRIELPKGSYVPAFSAQAEVEAPPAEPARRVAVALDDWPWVVVGAFASAGPAEEQRAAAARVRNELVLELGRYRDVRVLRTRELNGGEDARGDRKRFVLGGRVREEDGSLRVAAHLEDRSTGEQVWGDEYGTVPGPHRWSGSLEDIARVIAARVGSEEGVVVQHLAAERRKARRAAASPYEAILLSYEFFLARNLESLEPAVQALQQVVKEDPECGPAWTRLARLYVANYSQGLTALDTPLDQAITYAQQGVRVDPASRRARCILAVGLLVKDELAAARDELEEALRLTPDSLVYLEIIGYFLALVGDWTRGLALIRTARERNPHCLPHAAIALWLDHLRKDEVGLAYQEALVHRDPTSGWRSVMRASCLGLMGRTREAEAEAAELLRNKPDFAARGRTLIGYYVKPPELRDRIAEGLLKAGLKLA